MQTYKLHMHASEASRDSGLSIHAKQTATYYNWAVDSGGWQWCFFGKTTPFHKILLKIEKK